MSIDPEKEKKYGQYLTSLISNPSSFKLAAYEGNQLKQSRRVKAGHELTLAEVAESGWKRLANNNTDIFYVVIEQGIYHLKRSTLTTEPDGTGWWSAPFLVNLGFELTSNTLIHILTYEEIGIDAYLFRKKGIPLLSGPVICFWNAKLHYSNNSMQSLFTVVAGKGSMNEMIMSTATVHDLREHRHFAESGIFEKGDVIRMILLNYFMAAYRRKR